MTELIDSRSVTFDGFDISSDGERLGFYIKDAAEKTEFITVDWRTAPIIFAMLAQASSKAKERRKALGKTDTISAEVLTTYHPVENFELRISGDSALLTFYCSHGIRLDVAVSTNQMLGDGTRLIAELSDALADAQHQGSERAH